MKPRFLLLIALIVIVFSLSAAAQEKDFEISVSLKNTTFFTAGKEIPAAVKLTNKAARDLNTEDLAAGMLFKLSKCSAKEKCAGSKQIYFGGLALEPKILKPGESFEFDVNLADLNWNDANAPLLDFTYVKTMVTIPAGEYNLFAEINIFNGSGKKKPSRTIYSNEIKVKLNPKGN